MVFKVERNGVGIKDGSHRVVSEVNNGNGIGG